MGFLKFIKRKYQWRGEHYLEAIAEEDIDKRRAIFSEFVASLRKHVVLVELIDKNVQDIDVILIKNSLKCGHKSIYEIAEQVAEDLKAPKTFKN